MSAEERINGEMDELRFLEKTQEEQVMNAPSSEESLPTDELGNSKKLSGENKVWCRNGKYIECVANGFMCTICKKTYDRENTASYHVTIYHRQPPIKCNISGCQFTTREEIYLHFHKHYKHNIALPDSIDSGSRKCPFCRHISKSPIMLEKHIKIHMNERVQQPHQCPQCPMQLSSQRAMYDHMLTHSEEKSNPGKQSDVQADKVNHADNVAEDM